MATRSTVLLVTAGIVAGSTAVAIPASASQIYSLRSAVASVANGKIVPLGFGTYIFSDFDSSLIGTNVPSTKAGIQGEGPANSVVEMTPHSSTKAGRVPTAAGSSNQLTLLQVSGSPVVKGFSLVGTDQGHLYNGLRVASARNARVSDLRVGGIPGNFDSPPGETFGINDWNTTGSVYSNVVIDGIGIGASDFATNSSQNVSVTGSSFKNSHYGAGATFWQTRNVSVSDTAVTGNKDAGLNFERVTGSVKLTKITTGNNRLADLRIGNDQASATYTIVDPKYSGSKLVIMLTPVYAGRPNLQRKSDIHVIVNGVDRTNSVVQWKTSW